MDRLYYGPYSTVFKQEGLAVKVIDKDFAIPPHSWRRELKFLQHLCHKNIVKLVKLQDKFDEIMLYMEYYPQTLADLVLEKCVKKSRFNSDGQLLLSKVNKLEFDRLIEIISEVIDGLHYLHLQGVIHRDIKPSNVLVNGDKVVLCDFSILVEEKENDHITDVCSGYYKPLELIFALDYSYEIDVWCLGILISTLMSKDGSNILYDLAEDMDRENISDFLLIERIFRIFGTPSQDPLSFNYWPEIFDIDNFSLINLVAKERVPMEKIFPKCANNSLLQLFNKMCNLNSSKRIGIEDIRDEFGRIKEEMAAEKGVDRKE